MVLINPAAEKLTGWLPTEATGKSIDVVFPIVDEQQQIPHETPVSRVLQSGQVLTQSKPLLLRRRNETVRLITHSSAPVRDHAGQIIGAVLVFHDITDQTRMEQQLQQAQKMESIGLLAGGIAHDFNNLLTGIIGTADLALFDLNEDALLYEDLQNIKKQGQHGAALTKQLLAFSRRQILEPQFVNLNDIMHEVDHFIRRIIGRHIALIVSPEPALATVYADPVPDRTGIAELVHQRA